MFGTIPIAAPQPKAVWASKTFWLNVLGAVALLLNGGLGTLLPPAYLELALAALNIGNRFLTDRPVSLFGPIE